MLTSNLATINQGSTHVITLTVSGSGLDLQTAGSITFVIAASDTATALVSKTVGSGVTVVSSTVATIALVGSDTAALSGTYHYEIRCVNATSQTDLVVRGSVAILPNVTG